MTPASDQADPEQRVRAGLETLANWYEPRVSSTPLAEIALGTDPPRRKTAVVASLSLAAVVALVLAGVAVRMTSSSQPQVATAPQTAPRSVAPAAEGTGSSWLAGTRLRDIGFSATVTVPLVLPNGESTKLHVSGVEDAGAVIATPFTTIGVPGASTTVDFTTKTPAEVADAFCADMQCVAAGSALAARPGLDAADWRADNVALDMSTVTDGQWTLVVRGPDATARAKIVGSTSWTVADNGLVVVRDDPSLTDRLDQSGVRVAIVDRSGRLGAVVLVYTRCPAPDSNFAPTCSHGRGIDFRTNPADPSVTASAD